MCSCQREILVTEKGSDHELVLRNGQLEDATDFGIRKLIRIGVVSSWRVSEPNETAVLTVSHHYKERWTRRRPGQVGVSPPYPPAMSAIRATPLIPQHEFHHIRSLASAVPLPRSRRGIKHIALLCIGPVCVLLIWLFTGSRSSISTISLPGSAAVEDLVRKGREGYRAAKQQAVGNPLRKGKLRLDTNGE